LRSCRIVSDQWSNARASRYRVGDGPAFRQREQRIGALAIEDIVSPTIEVGRVKERRLNAPTAIRQISQRPGKRMKAFDRLFGEHQYGSATLLGLDTAINDFRDPGRSVCNHNIDSIEP
jgi:hypothetical protein